MGQLDEAIRAHLELKRKHGASEEELEAEEHEALGPVRREPPGGEPAQPAEPELDVEPEVPVSQAYDEPTAPVEGEIELSPDPGASDIELPPEPGASDYEPPPGQVEGDFEPPPVAAPGDYEPPPEPFEEDPDADLHPADSFQEPAEPAEPLAPAQSEPMAPETGETPARGFDAVEEPTPEDEGEAEDVLEETPDFLQETPEHDRLWFEQKPPRDFDFDE